MELPKTYGELAIYVLTQFPVLGAAFGIAYWVNREAKNNSRTIIERLSEAHLAVLRGNEKAYLDLLAEREKRITERDDRIEELKDDLIELKSKLTRAKKPEGEK